MMMMMMMMIVYGDVDDDYDYEVDDAQPMTNTMMMVVGVMTMAALSIIFFIINFISFHQSVSPSTHPYLSIHQLHHKSNRYSMIDVWMDG
jgi:hypothetical protein